MMKMPRFAHASMLHLTKITGEPPVFPSKRESPRQLEKQPGA